ncbi:MarR family transcriptional regulator [Mannheimia varigena USDA-ARS-USMARC-1388]|uniref:MarR family winged helix-turn-helix transcriptional regulator n=1 Tax=Mannheimia varigena TaxID=85404 RepID=UPI0003E31F9E|nr:MarR family transcriptional regulator [Mannheimia varigena]AHG79514.1 MarR family transcriptional regulator [Mannheimia varigena USDA-ARS-USMARC-1388]
MANFDELTQHVSEIDAVLDNWIAKLGLTYNHFAVLHTLAEQPNGCTQKQIAEEWYLPKQTVFNICKEYREKGWIEFAESESDKRERILLLTEQGKHQAMPIKAKTDAMIEGAFARFGTKKTEQLFKLMAELSAICRGEIKLHHKIAKSEPHSPKG